MNRFFSLFLLFSSLFIVACGNRENSDIDDTLFCIQRNYYCNADSTLAILDSVSAIENLSKQQNAHCCLLKVMHYDKLFQIEKHNSDSLIDVALDFYSKGKDYYMYALSLSFKARVANLAYHSNFELKSKCYNQALEALAKCKNIDSRLLKFSKNKTSKDKIVENLKYRIISRLAYDYNNAEMYEEALSSFYMLKDYFADNADSLYLAQIILSMSLTYLELNQYDSCLYLVQQADDISAKLNNDDISYGLNVVFAEYYLKMIENKVDTSNNIDYCNKALSALKDNVDINLKYNIENSYSFNKIAQIYLSMNQYDSVIYYSKAAEAVSKTGKYIAKACHNMAKAYMQLGDYENSAKYFEKYTELSDNEKNDKAELVAAKAEYEEKQIIEKNKNIHKIHRLEIVITATILIALIVVFGLTLKKHKNDKELIQLRNYKINRDNSDFVKSKLLTNNNLYKKVMSLSYDEQLKEKISITNDDWNDFVKITDMIYEGYAHTLKDLHPSLTKGDIRICCLEKNGLSPETSALLLGIGMESFKRRMRRLKQRMS